MTDKEEKYWIQGRKSAWLSLLRICLTELGYDNEELRDRHSWIMEREEALVQLRELCEDFGDNDFPDDLHLGDAIEKHLGKYLWGK
jgi:hypothetical protein